MMIRVMTIRPMTAIAAGLGLGLSGCASEPPRPSLDQAQCVAADWSAQGYRDAVAGRGSTRLEQHAAACAPHGIIPDAQAYQTGHLEGRRIWCRPASGFDMGRRGGRYNPGYCPADLEPGFMQAVADGRQIHDARTFAETLQGRVGAAQIEADRAIYDLRAEEQALGAEGLTEAQRDAIRQRIRSLRIDRDRRLSDVARLQSEADVARRDAEAVVNRFIPTYGG